MSYLGSRAGILARGDSVDQRRESDVGWCGEEQRRRRTGYDGVDMERRQARQGWGRGMWLSKRPRRRSVAAGSSGVLAVAAAAWQV